MKNMYFGKGFELEALPELIKGLPNHKVELSDKHTFSICKDGVLVSTIHTNHSNSRYAFIKTYSKNGEYIGGTSVEKLDEAVDDILNQ